MKTRVIWFIDGLGHGGAEHLLPIILAHFNSDQFEHRVCVFSVKSGNPNAELIRNLGIPVDLLPIPNLRSPGNLPRLIRYLRQYRPDIVHTQLEFANTLGSLAAWLLQIPSLATLHVMEEISKQSREYWRHRLMWTSLRICARKVLTVSNCTRDFFLQTEHFPPEKLMTIYNGIDLSSYPSIPSDPSRLPAELGIAPGESVLITVAYLREPKGIQFMLQALPAVLAQRPNCRYLIVGDGEFRPTLEQIARDLGIAERVIFTGKRADIPALLGLSDIFVLPTLNDALPTVLMESMAAGKPIVASNLGGVPEMVIDGENGLLVPLQDPQKLAQACMKLLEDPTGAVAMGETGKRMVTEHFSIEGQCRRLEEIYSEIIAGN